MVKKKTKVDEHPAPSNGTMLKKKKDVDEHPTQSSATRAGTPYLSNTPVNVRAIFGAPRCAPEAAARAREIATAAATAAAAAHALDEESETDSEYDRYVEDRDDWCATMESNPKHWLKEVIEDCMEESDEVIRLIWAARDSQEFMEDELERLNAKLEAERAEAIAAVDALRSQIERMACERKQLHADLQEARTAPVAASSAATADAAAEEAAATANNAAAEEAAATANRVEETAATANKVKEETTAIAAAEKAAAIAANLAREIDQLKRQLVSERATAATAIAAAEANSRVFIPGTTPVTYGEYQLHDLCCQVEHLHSQLNAAAHEAHYWANRAYTAEITDLNASAVQVQRRHQPPTIQHSENSETSPANADNAAAAVAAAALRAAADAASAAASAQQGHQSFLDRATSRHHGRRPGTCTVSPAECHSDTCAAGREATSRATETERPAPASKPAAESPTRRSNSQQPPGPKVRAQHPGASFTSSNRAANAPVCDAQCPAPRPHRETMEWQDELETGLDSS